MMDKNRVDYLSNLPVEIQTNICEILCDHCCTGWDSKVTREDPLPINYPSNDFTSMWEGESRTPRPPRRNLQERISAYPLRSLCLTSKYIKNVAQPVLFHFFVGGGRCPDRVLRLHTFASAVKENPTLAQIVKSLSIDYVDEYSAWRPDYNGRYRDYSPFESYKPDVDALYKTNRDFSKTILEHANQVKQLEISFSGNDWVPSSAVFSHLTELSIHNTWPCSTLGKNLVSTFLPPGNRIQTLALSNFCEFDNSILDVVSNVRHLTMVHFRDGRTSNIKALVKAMPRLESFRFCHRVDSDGVIYNTRASEVLDQLISRKESLKLLVLDRCVCEGAISRLQKFQQLECLDMGIDWELQPDDFRGLRFPKSLKSLVIRETQHLQGWMVKVASSLKQNIHLHPNLESVHGIVEFPSFDSGWSFRFHCPWEEEVINGLNGQEIIFSYETRNQSRSDRKYYRRTWGHNVMKPIKYGRKRFP